MKKYAFLLIPLAFLWLAISGCKKKCRSDEPSDFLLFDFRLVDKNTNQSLIGTTGQFPYHKDSIKIKHTTNPYINDQDVRLTNILVPDPVAGYYFRNINILGFSAPDYNKIYHFYLNKNDTDTIVVKSNGSANGCYSSVKFYYNGIFISQHDYDGNNNNRPVLNFKK